MVAYLKRYGLILVLLSSSFLSVAQNLDVDLLKSINRNGSHFKDSYLEFYASSVTYVTVGAPLIILTSGLVTHDKKLQRDAAFMAGSYFLSGGLTWLIKHTVKKARPYETYDFIVKRDDEAGGYSFPSGHTSAVFNLATSLSLRYPKWQVIVPSFFYAGSVAWARMYQGVHYPSDILAGALVGSATSYIGYRLQKALDKKKYKIHHETMATVSI